MEAYRLLLKSSWSAHDIAEYYGVSHNVATNIKTDVEILYGTPAYYATKERTCVKADDVIRFMGGNSRMEEMQLIRIATEINHISNE